MSTSDYNSGQLTMRGSFSSASNHNKPFTFMDITVTVMTLNGILVKSKKKKDKRLNDDTIPRHRASSDIEGGLPVTAVVSVSKNVTSSQTTIASHFPSLPLHQSVQHTHTDKQRLIASWPKDYDSMGNKLETFQISRMMRKNYKSNSSDFVPERLHISVGLTRGSEIINVGTTTLVVTGDESQGLHRDLPVKFQSILENDKNGSIPSITKSNSSSLFSRKKSYKSMKPVSFNKDPQNKYTIDPNACLKVFVRVTPTSENIGVETGSSQIESQIQYYDSASHSGNNSSYDMKNHRSTSSANSSSTSTYGNDNDYNHVTSSNSTSTYGNDKDYNHVTSSSSTSMYGNENDYTQATNSKLYGHQNSYTQAISSMYKNKNDHTDVQRLSQLKKSKNKNRKKFSIEDMNSCSLMPDVENNFHSTPMYFCGGLMDFMNPEKFKGVSNSKALSTLKTKMEKMYSKGFKNEDIVDNYSVMATYRNNDDNESQFIPPSKIYANNGKEDDDASGVSYECTNSRDDEEESNFCSSRLDHHSVATERIKNNSQIKFERVKTRIEV